MDLSFLNSTRFWKLFAIGIVTGLNIPLPNNPWLQGFTLMIDVWFGGSIVVRTADRQGDKKVEAATITADATVVNAQIVANIPPLPPQ